MSSRFIKPWVVLYAFCAIPVMGAQVSLESTSSYENIMDDFTILADFLQKNETRSENGLDDFWKYRFPPATVEFSMDESLGALDDDVPVTEGVGRMYEHLNYGRKEFLLKNYEFAKSTWLSARTRYGNSLPHHQRLDYFIGVAIFRLAIKKRNEIGPFYKKDMTVKNLFESALFFFNQAFVNQDPNEDPFLKRVAPRVLWAITAIYHTFDRPFFSFRVSKRALDYLENENRKEWKAEFRLVQAEGWIKNGDYFRAAQELDKALKEKNTPQIASHVTARLGDIYYDLNNYELARDMFEKHIKINEIVLKTDPLRSLYLGESLFWMGRFSDAQKSMWLGLFDLYQKSTSSDDVVQMAPWALLRMADAYLIRWKNKEDVYPLIKTAYDRVIREFPHHEVSQIAKIRLYCATDQEMTEKNILHSRDELTQLGEAGLPQQAIEMAKTCRLQSYFARNETGKAIPLIEDFHKNFRESTFNPKIIDSMKQFRASLLDELLERGDETGAISFYEAYKDSLFPHLSKDRESKLFFIYVKFAQNEKAKPFFQSAVSKSLIDELYKVLYLLEAGQKEKNLLIFSRSLHQISQASQNQDIAKELPRLLPRLLSTDKSAHLEWIIPYIESWISDESSLCEKVIPFFSEPFKPIQAKKLTAFLDRILKEHFPKILQTQTECAHSILQTENKMAKILGKDTSGMWLNRLDWNFDEATIPFFWEASETLFLKGKKEEAKKIWEKVEKLAPPNSLHANLAKLRLTEKETDLEKMWKR